MQCKWKKRVSIWIARLNNAFVRMPRNYREASPGRRAEFRKGRALCLRHPWWFFMDEPNIEQVDPVTKHAFAIINGPIWRYEYEQCAPHVDVHIEEARPITNHEMMEIIAMQHARQQEESLRKGI